MEKNGEGGGEGGSAGTARVTTRLIISWGCVFHPTAGRRWRMSETRGVRPVYTGQSGGLLWSATHTSKEEKAALKN